MDGCFSFSLLAQLFSACVRAYVENTSGSRGVNHPCRCTSTRSCYTDTTNEWPKPSLILSCHSEGLPPRYVPVRQTETHNTLHDTKMTARVTGTVPCSHVSMVRVVR